MTFSSRHHNNEEVLPRLFFLSLIFHGLCFALLVINPLSLLLFEFGDDEGPSDTGANRFEVELFAFQPEPSAGEARGLFPQPPPGQAQSSGLEDLPPSLDFIASEGFSQDALPALNPTALSQREQQARKAALMMADSSLGSVEQLLNADILHESLPPQVVTTTKLPPNMTGPQDCRIKVVDMVCPKNGARCIEDYLAFCASLPD